MVEPYRIHVAKVVPTRLMPCQGVHMQVGTSGTNGRGTESTSGGMLALNPNSGYPFLRSRGGDTQGNQLNVGPQAPQNGAPKRFKTTHKNDATGKF